ncbi:MAG TPA: hypothetical protein VKB77_07450, partial [Terriglobales bacterium]|nr:hypothetical protein [Terriglobales bacterium]
QQVVTGHQTQTVTNAQGQPLLDAQGNPITRSVPIVETIGMPVDMATAKQSLTPLRARLIEEMSEADMKSSRGLKALDTVLEGPDYLPASVADKKLGAIKALLREKGVNDRTKYFAEQALTALDPLIDKAVATGGPKATQALQEGRLFTKAKYATRQTLKELPEEPIGVFQKLTRPGDAGINLLRDVQTHAPDAMPAVGRAYMQGLFDTALGEAGKPPNTKLAISNWAKLGDATKKILFSADQIKSIDRFLKLSDIEASVPSTASAAPRNWLGSLAVNVLPETLMMGAGHLAHYPKLGVEAGLGYAGLRGIWALGSRGMANLLWNPANARMVTEGIRLPSMPGAIGATTAKGAIEYARGGTILDRQPSRQQVLNSLRGYADGGVADDGTIYLGDRPGEFYNRLQLGPRVQAIRSTNRPMGTIQSEPPVMPVGPSLKDVQIGAQQGASDWARMLFKPSEAIYGRVPLASGKTLSEAATGMVGPDPREVEARQSPTSQGLQFLGRMPFDIPRYGMMTAAAGGNPMLGMAAADALGAETPWGAVKQGATGAAMGKGMELGMHGLAQVPGYVRENVLPGLRDVISSRPATTFAREQLEAVPGRVTGHLPGMTDLPFNERDYFTRQAMGAFEDPRGRDILQAATGLPTAPMEPMIGSFKEPGKPWDVNPGRSLAAEVPVEWTPKEGGGFTPRLPADVQANLRGTAGVHGAMLGQAGVGIPALVPQKAGRSFRMELPETPPLTPEAMTTLSKTYPEYAMAHTGTGIEALDISDLNLSPLQRANAAKIVNAAKTINADNIGDYIDYSDAWAKKPGSGEVTRQMLGYIDAMKPEQQAALDQAVRQPAGDLYKLYEQTAQSKKLPVRRDLMNLLTVMRDKGIPGVREGIKSGAFLPGLVGAVLLPSLFRGTSEPSGQAGPI